MDIKVLAISTDFKHHGDNAGYKQILKYVHPFITLGIRERNNKTINSKIKSYYQWLFEFEAYKYRNKVDLVHILYAEDYFRWSARLFKKVPLVATFHQPAELLKHDVLTGDYKGRVGRITHLLNKNRFIKLGAAIVTNVSQIAVLERVMPKEKIHFLPLGVHMDVMNRKFENYFANNINVKKPTGNIITVGNWQRDWDFYFSVVRKCPHWKFSLINNNLEGKYREIAAKCVNLSFFDDISDDEMYNLFLKSDLQFIPAKGMAGSNALLQGLALGCPLVLTNINAKQFQSEHEIIKLYQKGSVEDCIKKMEQIMDFPKEIFQKCKMKSHAYANNFSWKRTAERTIEIYKQLV